jgi:hypothetical protein
MFRCTMRQRVVAFFHVRRTHSSVCLQEVGCLYCYLAAVSLLVCSAAAAYYTACATGLQCCEAWQHPRCY